MKRLSYIAVLMAVPGLILVGCDKNPVRAPDGMQGGLLLSEDCTTFNLIAGQNTIVGNVTVSNDVENLYVTYTTMGDWHMTKTHLHVAESLVDIPQNKNSSPTPGKFEYKTDPHEPPVTDFTYTIPLNSWEPDTELYIAAHAVVVRPIDGCTETVWQIGYVETVDSGTGQLTCYFDEFNHQPDDPLWPPFPVFADPFVVETSSFNEFPFNSNFRRGYATDFDVEWDGALPFGGELTISWSPGKSAYETKIITSLDNSETETFNEWGSTDPTGWRGYPLVESVMSLENPIGPGTHYFRFQHMSGDGTYWDWVRLDKPCEQSETAWSKGDEGETFDGKNWATYFTYEVQAWDLSGDWVLEFTNFRSPPSWPHDLTVTSHNRTTGVFEGHGGFPASGPPHTHKWVLSSATVSGNDVTFRMDYTEGPLADLYWLVATGVIASDGTMSGSYVDNGYTNGGVPIVGTWQTTSGAAGWY